MDLQRRCPSDVDRLFNNVAHISSPLLNNDPLTHHRPLKRKKVIKIMTAALPHQGKRFQKELMHFQVNNVERGNTEQAILNHPIYLRKT